MTQLLRLLLIAVLVALPALPALADEPENLAADAKQAVGEPPTVPHKIGDGDASSDCLTCHKTGIKKAPQTSHPEWIGCTQCHVAGEPKVKPAKKTKKK